MNPPRNPKIYHITHVDNLPGIITAGGLLSDARIVAHGGPAQLIGMSSIKRRRIEELEVPCHPGTKVGEYVPFYFCPRSVMLYVIHCANHPELSYRGGQDLIVHLEADMHTIIRWADQNGVRWAFSLTNAGAYYTGFRSSIADLSELDWDAIFATDFRDPDVKERKQAEFLVYEKVPWHLIERIGVRNRHAAQEVYSAVQGADRKPRVEVLPGWYY